jgi:YndJ-like protein
VPEFGVVEAVFALGLVTAVPLGLRRVAAGSRPFWVVGLAGAVVALVARSRTLGVHSVAVIAATCWLVVSVGLAVRPTVSWFAVGGRGWSRPQWRQRFALRSLLHPAAFVFLVVGASWLLLSTLRQEVLGFPEQIVLLTGVHFHFAGFATAVVAIVRIDAAASAASAREHRWAVAGGWLAIGGPACVAIGHLTFGFMELVGAFVMAAVAAFQHSRSVEGNQRLLLRFAAFAPIVTMALALHYALNRVVNVHPLSYANIASIHGVLNVVAFLSGNLLVGGASLLPQRTPADVVHVDEAVDVVEVVDFVDFVDAAEVAAEAVVRR